MDATRICGNGGGGGSGTPLSRAISLVLAENSLTLQRISCAEVAAFASAADGRRLFLAGEGRSGLVMRMAAMRMMHLGWPVHVVGETTTPSISSDDLLVVFSGSGRSNIVTTQAAAAKVAGSRVIAVTASPTSPLAQTADSLITIVAPAKDDLSGESSAQFAGSLFEQAAMLLFDAIFHSLAGVLSKTAMEMWSSHANLE
jgi:6-phospho-3-hexuloisomerase